MKANLKCFTAFFIIIFFVSNVKAQEPSNQELLDYLKKLEKKIDNLEHQISVVEKTADDVLWYKKVGDVAQIDKVLIYGPPSANVKDPKAMGANNPILFNTYVFIPKDVDRSKKYPLIVFPHGGVHSNFSTFYARAVREFIAQGYVVVAPEYRGSTGYGKWMYDLIDYGGLEVEDTYASRNYMIENYDFVDKDRIGIFGWSHGGTIALLNIFHHPKDYKVAYAGEPVSDLISRMGYMTDEYRALYSADYHIGKTAHEDVEEYKRRSPIWHADKLETPLLIYGNTNDEDVNVLEVELLINALKAEGKDFESKIFEDYPGGHNFDRIDTKQSREIQLDIYQFLAKYLNPPKPFKNLKDLTEAGYQ